MPTLCILLFNNKHKILTQVGGQNVINKKQLLISYDTY